MGPLRRIIFPPTGLESMTQGCFHLAAELVPLTTLTLFPSPTQCDSSRLCLHVMTQNLNFLSPMYDHDLDGPLLPCDSTSPWFSGPQAALNIRHA